MGRGRPSKPGSSLSNGAKIDAFVTSKPIKDCVKCIKAGGFACLSSCLPNPFSMECFHCLTEKLPQCLSPCGKLQQQYFLPEYIYLFFQGFPQAHIEFTKCVGSCAATHSNVTGKCTITEDHCGDCKATALPTGCNCYCT